jgi:hypothetical protein
LCRTVRDGGTVFAAKSCQKRLRAYRARSQILPDAYPCVKR